jgi:hypothetical protein
MNKNNLKRFLASLLAVLMLSQVTGVAPGVFAEETAAPELVETSNDAPKEVLIKSNYTDEQVLSALATALLTNADQVDAQSLSWSYTCAVKGSYKNAINQTKYTEAREDTFSVLKSHEYVQKDYTYDVTGSGIFRKEWKADVTYVYPALKDNTDGAYTLYLNNEAVYINKVAKLKSAINVVNTVPEIAIPYNADGSVNNAKLHESIFKAVVTGTTPAGLTYDQLSYPDNFSEGEQTITISYAGNDDYSGTSKDVKVKFVDGRNVAFTAKEQPKTLSIGYVGSLPNEEATLAKVREQLINKVGDVDLNQVKIEYNVAFGKYAKLDIAAVLGHVLVATDIKLTYAGDATHKPFTKIFENIKFADNRVASSIVLKENASITYNKEKGAMKQDIFDNAIDWEATKLPEGITKDDLTFECNTSLVPKITVWGDIDGKEYPNLDAGDAQKIRISFVGNSDFKPGEFEFTIKVAKAHVDVSMNAFTKAYAGNEDDLTIEKLGITLNPNDPRIDIYRVFVGINTNLKASVNLVLTDKQWEFIENVSKAQAWLYDKAPSLFPSFNETIQDKLEKGMTIAEFKEYMNNAITAIENAANDETWGPIVQGGLDLFHIDLDAIKALASVFDVLTMVSDDLTIAVGVPKHAGLYRVYAIAANKNYETNFASGTVLILMNWKDIKIVPNADLKKQTITVSEAKEYADGTKAAATLLNKSTGESSGIDQSALHYRFTGLNKIYSSHDFPTAPGKYIVTVSVRGGDYYALPTTFTFTVKAD